MKALALHTHTADCEKTWRSFECLGQEVVTLQYDDRPHDRHPELIERAKEVRPDFIIYIGAIEKYHQRPVPSPDILKALNEVAPMVHICGDSCDKPWWEWLNLYNEEKCFALQVGIDGSFSTPLMHYGKVLLTPTIPDAFNPQPWNKRNIYAGMAGGLGHGERAALIHHLNSTGDLTWMDASKGASYQSMADFMSSCKIIVNSPMNGTGDGYHVKGRVLETAYAGACLLEKRDSPTAFWFEPDLDYMTYGDIHEAARKLEWAYRNPHAVREMAKRLQVKVYDRHHPRVFWKTILQKIGLGAKL